MYPRGGLPRNSVERITDRHDMTSAVDRGRKASTQTNTQLFILYHIECRHALEPISTIYVFEHTMNKKSAENCLFNSQKKRRHDY